MPTVESTVQLHATAGGNQGLPSNRGPRLLSYYSDQFLKAFISRLKKNHVLVPGWNRGKHPTCCRFYHPRYFSLRLKKNAVL
jgi:hypothetical protein